MSKPEHIETRLFINGKVRETAYGLSETDVCCSLSSRRMARSLHCTPRPRKKSSLKVRPNL